MSEYVVIYEQADDGVGRLPPRPARRVAIATTREEVAERIQEALSAYAEDLQQRGATLPTPHHTTGTIAA